MESISWIALFVAALVSLVTVNSQSAPSFCSYADGVFTCDYGMMVSASDRPIDFSQFSPVPQRLEVSVNGYVPFFGDNQTFSSTFSSIDTNQFDANYPASLTFDCGWGGSLFLESGAFSNISHVQHLKIRNCDTYNIPSAAFADLQDLDYFGFEGGFLDSVDANAMSGLNVEKLTSATHQFPQKLGHFELRYTKMVSKVLPPGILYSWKNLTSVAFRGADIETVTSDTFKYNTKLRSIDLSDNPFTSLPNNLWSGLHALSEVHLYNINWTCSCDNNWFIEYADTNNISLYGDLVCADPTGISARNYWYSNCLTSTVCGEAVGFEMSGKCMTALALSMYIAGAIAFVVCIVALALAIHTKRMAGVREAGRQRAKGRWNKVLNAARGKGKTSAWESALQNMKK